MTLLEKTLKDAGYSSEAIKAELKNIRQEVLDDRESSEGTTRTCNIEENEKKGD
jgi:hypothetical protein